MVSQAAKPFLWEEQEFERNKVNDEEWDQQRFQSEDLGVGFLGGDFFVCFCSSNSCL